MVGWGEPVGTSFGGESQMRDMGSGEHADISPVTNKRVQPRKDSAVHHHLLNCNYSPSFEDVLVLWHENKKYLLKLKESLFIMRDRLSINQNIVFAPL